MRILVSLLCMFLLVTSCAWNEILPVCEPDEQMFLDSVQPIIKDNCMECHDVSNSRPAVLGTYDDVINALNNHSLRDRVINREMPPPEKPSMSESDINIIKNWVDCE